ncbi:MAG: hypothetical protein ACAH80_17115 [Alphaproteobacteria bacterium]
MSVNKFIPYKLRSVFAAVANIPAAVGALPFLPFASKSGNDTPLEVATLIGTTAALAFGIAAAPILTTCIALPLYCFGRIGQAVMHEYQPLPYRLLDVDFRGDRHVRDALRR